MKEQEHLHCYETKEKRRHRHANYKLNTIEHCPIPLQQAQDLMRFTYCGTGERVEHRVGS